MMSQAKPPVLIPACLLFSLVFTFLTILQTNQYLYLKPCHIPEHLNSGEGKGAVLREAKLQDRTENKVALQG